MRVRRGIASLVIGWALSLGVAQCGATRGTTTTPEAAGDYAPEIPNQETWEALAAKPGRQMVARTEVVKVIIDLEDNWKVYFLQSRRWEIHYFFASQFLSTPGHWVEDHASFNIREYRRQDRRFILGTLAYYKDADTWAYELVASDVLDLPRTARAFETVRAKVFFGQRLRYRPVPSGQENRADELRAQGVPLVMTAELYGKMLYQPVNPGEAWGRLRFIEGPPEQAGIRRTDIVVLREVPLDLPVCAGIVTSELQAPLSHVAVLAQNRGTPDMALRNAHQEAALRRLDGRLVHLRVGPQDYDIEATTQLEAERAWESMRPSRAFSPVIDAEFQELKELRTLRKTDLARVGAKAAQLGELSAVGSDLLLPRGFALPFHAYFEHLRRNGLAQKLQALLNEPSFQQDPDRRRSALESFRRDILQAPVDPGLLNALRARVRMLFPDAARVRLRSSTNAEDLPGFNGAGLYRSTIVSAEASDAQWATALREVWASLWNFQGYEERSFFRIDQSRVAMAVLVQESVDSDVVDGVAITGNPFNEGRPGFYLNAQWAGAEGGSVTAARGDEVPEQWMYYTYGEEREMERLARSSLRQGAPVLTDDEVFRLATQLRAIQTHFHPDVSTAFGGSSVMDVEFLLAGPERRIVIVQARPYTLHFDQGRTRAERPDN